MATDYEMFLPWKKNESIRNDCVRLQADGEPGLKVLGKGEKLTLFYQVQITGTLYQFARGQRAQTIWVVTKKAANEAWLHYG